MMIFDALTGWQRLNKWYYFLKGGGESGGKYAGSADIMLILTAEWNKNKIRKEDHNDLPFRLLTK